MRIKLKRLNKVTTKRGNGVYYYAWRGGPRIKTDAAPGTPAFMTAYNEAIAFTKRPFTGKVAELITAYKQSSEFTGLADRTQRDYRRQLKMIEVKFGNMPIIALESRQTRGVFKEWRDRLAEKSFRQADYAWTVLQRVFSVAKDRGKIDTNPCEKGGRLYTVDRTVHPHYESWYGVDRRWFPRELGEGLRQSRNRWKFDFP
jgi:hypothetical protein